MNYNKDVKEQMKESQAHAWQVAKELGIHETAFSKWFREPLTEERKEAVLLALERIKLNRIEEEN